VFSFLIANIRDVPFETNGTGTEEDQDFNEIIKKKDMR